MLHAFSIHNGRLHRAAAEVGEGTLDLQVIWLDMVAATEAERAWVERQYKVVLPSPEHLRDIEASARFYEEEGVLHLRSDFLSGKESHSHSVAVAFVVAGPLLISIHEEDLPIFRLLRMRQYAQSGEISNGLDVLIDLYGMDVEFSADALEEVYADLREVSMLVLDKPLSDTDASTVLASIAHAEHVNGRIRRNVMDTRRAISSLVRGKRLTPSNLEEAQQIMQDIESLDGHTTFLFDKINFLMGSTVGFISINQNRIVRLFSVASVALLPPTLIASIYGMNFEHMPELSWTYGYPFAVGLMLLTVGIPFFFFYRKGWLK
ncbi:MAG: magnesium/cobalt transporter CorA [Sideroxydans sp.]|nr:magnesium/cobalt transporter CorA [Sideroxydans sp.]